MITRVDFVCVSFDAQTGGLLSKVSNFQPITRNVVVIELKMRPTYESNYLRLVLVLAWFRVQAEKQSVSVWG